MPYIARTEVYCGVQKEGADPLIFAPGDKVPDKFVDVAMIEAGSVEKLTAKAEAAED